MSGVDDPGARYVARTVRGIEWVVADEVAALDGARVSDLRRREVTFTLDGLDPRDLMLRTADDLLAVVGRTAATPRTTADLVPWAQDAVALPWAVIAPAPVVDVVADVEGRRPFNRFAVEAALGDALVARFGGRFLRRTADGREVGDPTLTVRVFVRDDAVLVATRVGSRPLHRRDWKQDVGRGSLHPPLAAALVRLAGLHERRGPGDGQPPDGGAVLDPFCGDGTIAVEAALVTGGAVRILARDLDPVRVEHARANAGRAGARVDLEVSDAGRIERDGRYRAIVANPPWDNAVGLAGALRSGLDRFWDGARAALAPDGVVCVLADDSLGLPTTLRAQGWGVAVDQQVRVQGRPARVVVAAPGGRPRDDGGARSPAASLTRWRDRATAAGLAEL